MSKTFKQFITEVRVGYDVGIPKFKAKKPDELMKTHKVIHSGKLESGHDVTVAKDKQTGAKSVFIHHNGKHIGTIEAHHTKKSMMDPASIDAHKDHVLQVSKSTIHKDHQGKGIMTNTYKHLIHHGYTLRSDSHLTHTAHKMWSKLASDKSIKMKKAWHNDPVEKAKKHDPSGDVSAIPDDSTHYVASKK
jgi:hypothetical protein